MSNTGASTSTSPPSKPSILKTSKNHSQPSPDPLDAIQTLSLEEVQLPKLSAGKSKQTKSSLKTRKTKSFSMVSTREGQGRKAVSPGAGAIVSSRGADADIIRSGHQELNTLYASNDCEWRGAVTVNLVNAPNNSTTQCGCENINCPFCNLLLSIEQTDPSVLQ